MASSSNLIELIASSVKLVLLSKGYNVTRLRVVCGEEEDLERGNATF